jgi:putative SOS response-associated peptidase YedK
MCGRFTLRTSGERLARHFRLARTPELPFRYNVAPTQPIPVIRQTAEGRQLSMVRWGLVPRWARDMSGAGRMINARAETVATKPAFRDAFKHGRCLVVADGFYEWKKPTPRQREPYLIQLRTGEPFAFAGLWDTWMGPEGPIETCTIITTDANELVRSLHDRMPVILSPREYDRWLDPALEDVGRLEALLKPVPSESVAMTAVNPIVNNARNEDPRCVEPAPPATAVRQASPSQGRSRKKKTGNDQPSLF